MNAQSRNQFSGRISAAVLVSTLVLISLVMPVVARAALPHGDLVVGEGYPIGVPGLMVVDPITGNRTILSDSTHGTGPAFSDPTSITFETDGSLLVADTVAEALFRVDPTTGNRTIISSSTVGSGPSSSFLGARQFGNEILMTGPSVFSVDPATGNRAIVPGGTGTAQFDIAGFFINGTNAVVANTSVGEVDSLNTITGIHTIISGSGVGSGPSLVNIADVEPESSGDLLASLSTVLLH